jgi:hypothetical protein
MSAKTPRYSKIVVSSALALPLILSLFSLSTPAKAAQITMFNGFMATAEWNDFDLLVQIDKSGTGHLEALIVDEGFFGLAPITSNDFHVAPSLRTATLSPVTVDFSCGCGLPDKELTIQATWTAITNPTVSNSVFHFGIKHIEVTETGPTSTVLATAQGTLDGQGLGQSLPGAVTVIQKFTNLFISSA